MYFTSNNYQLKGALWESLFLAKKTVCIKQLKNKIKTATSIENFETITNVFFQVKFTNILLQKVQNIVRGLQGHPTILLTKTSSRTTSQ